MIFVLTETCENSDGSIDHYVMYASKSRLDLRRKMREFIDEDEYGFIAENGVNIEDDEHFSTNYADGYVEYEISEVNMM